MGEDSVEYPRPFKSYVHKPQEMLVDTFHWHVAENGGWMWLQDDDGGGRKVSSHGGGSWNELPMSTVYSFYQLRWYMEKTIIIECKTQTSEISDEITRSMSSAGYPARTISPIVEALKHPRRPYLATEAEQTGGTPPKKISQTRSTSVSSLLPISPRDSFSFFDLRHDGRSIRTISYTETDGLSLPDGPQFDPEASAEIVTLPGIDTPVFIVVKLDHVKNPPADVHSLPQYLFIIAGPDSESDWRAMAIALASLLHQSYFEEVVRNASDRKSLLVAVDDCLKRALIMSPSIGSGKHRLIRRESQEQLRQKRKMAGFFEKSRLDLASRSESEDSRKSSCNSEKSVKSVHYTELQRTGRFFGGLIEDLRLRMPLYIDDIRDAFDFQCLMSVVFIFFITCASAVAFGELIEEKTHGLIGVSEMLAAHAICNIVWGLIAGQPLCIQAGVGLLLAFEGSLYKFCDSYEVDYLSMRVWTGLWVVFLTLLITAFDGACLVRYLTRFTEEISTCLIAFFFIYEAALFFLKEFTENPIRTLFDYCFNFNSTGVPKGLEINGRSSPVAGVFRADGGLGMVRVNGTDYIVAPLKNHAGDMLQRPPAGASTPDTALLTLILALLTFGLVHWLTQVRKSKYFGKTMRKMISDLAVPIVLLVVTLLDQLLFKDIQTKHLGMPAPFERGHKWLVSPMGNGERPMPSWAILASFIPAVSVCILVFAEVELAEMQLSKPERLLKRPQGFHLDLIICGFLILVCSLLGLPWMCTGAVQTMAHVNSLTVFTRSKPIARRAVKRPSHVLEQRVTSIVVGILHGAAVFGGLALNLIPVAALFGIFIFLGVAGLSDLQLTQRTSLVLVPPKHFPRIPYCTEISVWRLHLFTLIQVLCVTALCVMKILPPASFMFPFALAGLALLRQFVLPKLYSSTQLEAIDGEEEEARDDDEGQDETMGAETDTYPCDRALRF